jgi:predicted transcriptional regulator
MKKTISEISRLKGVTKQAVQKFISQNNVQPSGKKGSYPTYDCSQPPLKTYLSGKAKAEKKQEPPSTFTPQPENGGDMDGALKPLNSLLKSITPPGVSPAAMLFGESLQIAKRDEDSGNLLKHAQVAAKEIADAAVRMQLIKTAQAKEQSEIEKAERLRLENAIRKEEFIERAIVKIVFGRLFAIDSTVLQSLGLKLSDMIDSLPPSPDRRIKIQKLIDDETESALESKRRQLAEFLQE